MKRLIVFGALGLMAIGGGTTSAPAKAGPTACVEEAWRYADRTVNGRRPQDPAWQAANYWYQDTYCTDEGSGGGGGGGGDQGTPCRAQPDPNNTSIC